MTWNYRLFKQDTPNSAEGKHLFFLAECYYDKNDRPELHSTVEHNHICGDSIEDTRAIYEMMDEAFDKPIIELDSEGNFKHSS